MKFFSAKEIKERLTCHQYIESQGHSVVNGRCNAFWRGGVNRESVHVEDGQWFDHALKQGGSVIDLCAISECGDIGNTFKAMQVLGERLGLTPVRELKKSHKTRSEILIEQGYKATATYDYTDEQGNVVYSIVRFEKDEYGPGEHKEFVHKTPEHEGLDKDTPKMLYNLPAVVKAQEVFIVEGEKDANTIRSFGYVATTNSGGASNWEQSFNKYFDGKDVVVLCDNDEPGRKHGQLLNGVLKPIAKSVKVITISSLPKGDVTDWLEKEGGSAQKLREIVDSQGEASADTPEIAAAKMANETSFTNFRTVTVTVGRGRTRDEEEPIPLNDIIANVSVRFLGFPRNLGSVLFDWDRTKKRVVVLENCDALFAWIQRISDRTVEWHNKNGLATQRQLFEGLRQSGIHYMGLSNAPHFPMRKDVFYTHEPFPAPDPTHRSFWNMIKFFSPANEVNFTMIAALFVAPIYYSQTATRPMWVVDTDDAQGSGKTTLVKMVAHLYGNTPLPIDMEQLNRDVDQITKRFLSSEGRQKRIALIDNVAKTLKSPNLASFITDSVISGRPAYGHGEEVRPNDITYVATVNGAQVDTDIATRCYTVRIKAPAHPKPTWERDVYEYIDRNRAQIFSDIIHMITTNQLSNLSRRKSRFGMFDSVVLSSVCKSEEEFRAVDDAISSEMKQANEDGDRAQEFFEIWQQYLAESICEENFGCQFFVMNRDIDFMLHNSDGALRNWTSQQIVQLVKQGRVTGFVRSVNRVPKNTAGIPRQRGLLFAINGYDQTRDVNILYRRGRKLTAMWQMNFGDIEIENESEEDED